MSDTITKTDVVSFLKTQHREIERLAGAVQNGTGEQRKEAFACFVRLLAVHETAEEEVIHPLVRGENAGEPVVKQRLREEGEAKKALYEIEQLEVGSPEFVTKFNELADAVRGHAESEELTEFPLLTSREDRATQEQLATMVSLAEKAAPTHAHPHTPQSAMGNLIVGPFAAVADRVRDALHH